MQLKFFLAASAASVSLAAGLSAPVHAQETTSAIAGKVTDPSGAPVAGAKITAEHLPSGTIASANADATGTFNLRGLRVGGPYTITIEAPGFPTQTYDNASLVLGETLELPIQFESTEIVVTGQQGARTLTTGSQSTYSASDIQDVVSARRDVRDIVRRDPLATYNANVGGVSIAGGNIRTQRFSVDGIQMQDSFGLNYGGLPSTRGIVSIEMIDQLTVKAAPFDISEGNFQGGAVNVVMKSGTNTFHGSGFGNFGGDKLTGDKTADNKGVVGDVYPVAKSRILDFRNYGGSVTGPIIPDTLFFAASYEKLTEGTPAAFGVTGSDAPNIVPNITQAQVDDVIARFKNSGYDAHEIGTVPIAVPEKDEKYAAKLDWNIVDGHRMSVSYIHHENVIPNWFSGANGGSTSTSTPNIQLQSDLYELGEKTDAYSGQINSQWSDDLSTEVRVAYKDYVRGQNAYYGPDYAQFNVCLEPTRASTFPAPGTVPGTVASAPGSTVTSCTTGIGQVRLGPDAPRQANEFNSQQLTLNANANYKIGNHTIKLEGNYFKSTLYNLFVYAAPGGPQGFYHFDSLSDFTNRLANQVAIAFPTTGDKHNGYVDWTYKVHTVGLQDTWRPDPTLTITAGARYDWYKADNTILANPNFANRMAVIRPGLTNTATLDGRGKLQPRLGFNWSPQPRLRISGGAGLFAGGLSDVFISNNYSNSGVAINSTGAAIASVNIVRVGGTDAAPTCVDTSVSSTNLLPAALCTAALTGVKGGSLPASVISYVQGNTGVLANAPTNSLDPKFKLPAQWKVNLSARYNADLTSLGLGDGWGLRGDMMLSRTDQGTRLTDLRSVALVQNGVVQTTPDGRPRYGGLVPLGNGGTLVPGSNYDIQLTNTTRGRAAVFAAGVDKQFGPVDFTASYLHQTVKDVAGVLVSSSVNSSFGVPTIDPNSGGVYGRSAFEVTHTIRATMNFKHQFFGDNDTRFGINWELRSGQPWSATMNDFFNSATTGQTCNSGGRACVFGTPLNQSNHLLYVPDFGATMTTVNQVAGSGATAVTYAAPKYGNVIFGSSLATGTAAQHAASAQATADAVKALVNATKLKDYQGQISPKNILTGPWYNKVDLNFAQQIPVIGRSKITLLASVENFLNLLNRDWGTYRDFSNTAVVRVACDAAAAGSAQSCANYVYSTYTAPRTQSYAKASLYAIRVGARFDF